MLIAKAESNSSSSFTPVPAGMHLARCFRIVDLGTQKTTYMGKDKLNRKILIQFEIHSEDADGNPLLTDKGEPLSISKRYTLSLNEKATLSIDLESWRGAAFTNSERKGFHLERLLGVWAMLNVTKAIGNDGKEYTNIETINPVPQQIKKTGLPKEHNDVMIFSIDNSPPADFERLSEGIKKTIQSSPEWQRKGNAQSTYNDLPDFGDEPF